MLYLCINLGIWCLVILGLGEIQLQLTENLCLGLTLSNKVLKYLFVIANFRKMGTIKTEF